MKLKTHISLEGTYSVDVYNRSGEFKYSTGPHKNFITSQGLSYVSNYAIADCFRFVSVGLDNSANTILGNGGWGTTYLGNILPQYSYIGGRDIQDDAGHLRSQYLTAGFTEHASGVLLSRSWRIPSGNSVFFDQDYTFEEIMLSPGRGYEVGLNGTADVSEGSTIDIFTTDTIRDNSATWLVNQWLGYVVRVRGSSTVQDRLILSNTSNTLTVDTSAAGDFSTVGDEPYTYGIFHIYQLCSCLDSVVNTAGETRNGLDYSSTAIYYSGTAHVDICAASGAFARMVKTINVHQDDYLIFHYDLNVGVDTGITPLFFDMSSASRNNRGLKQNSNWGPEGGAGGHNVSGIQSLIHHGFKLISPGTVVTQTPWGNMTQDGAGYWSADYDFGESFTSSWGAPLEPSARGANITAYLTNDNLQFVANGTNGGAYISSAPSFSGLSGLMEWRESPYNDAANHGFSLKNVNIRKVNQGSETKVWPIPSNYLTETEDPSTFQHVIKSLDTTFSTATAYGAVTPSDRTRTVTRAFQFAGPSAGDFANDGSTTHGAQIRGIVLGYKDSVPANSTSILPFFDCLFTDSGKNIGPRVIPRKNSPLVGQYATGTIAAGTASYWYYLESDAKLTFTFQQTWSSPCSPTVNGC